MMKQWGEQTPESKAIDPKNRVFAEWRAATGDEKASKELELIGLLQTFARSLLYVKLKEIPPELVNTVVFQAIHKADSFRGENGASFTTWFQHVVSNAANSFLRTRRHHRKEIPLGELSQGDVEHLPTVSDPEGLIGLISALEKLSDEDRSLVELKVDGWEEKDIAEKHGIAIITVRTRWRKLKRKILELVG